VVRVVVALLAALVLSSHAAAQVHKCRLPSGAYEYSGTPCASTNVPVQVIEAPLTAASTGTSYGTSSGGNAYEKQLRGLIAAAVARRDYRKAGQLAVTEEHWNIIRQAEAAELEEKRIRAEERRARRPVVCTRSGYAHPGGAYLDSTVCR